MVFMLIYRHSLSLLVSSLDHTLLTCLEKQRPVILAEGEMEKYLNGRFVRKIQITISLLQSMYVN